MGTRYWQTIQERLKEFWKPGQEIICTKVYPKKYGHCELCDHTPIVWHHVLLNSETKSRIIVGAVYVINSKKVMDKIGKDIKILYFERYRKAVDFLNRKHPGTAEIIPLAPDLEFIRSALSTPNNIDYKTLKSILDYTSKYESGEEYDLFHEALDIYINRELFLYDNHLDHSESIELGRLYAKDEIEEYWDSTVEYPYGSCSESSLEELCPEGMAPDDIDWDSHKYD